MTCCIDHDAENAIPLFLCVACCRDSMTLRENGQEAATANAIRAAVERGQGLEPAVHAR